MRQLQTLQELRMSRGLTKKHLAERFGVSEKTITQLEKDSEDISLNLLMQYAVFFQTSIDHIFIGPTILEDEPDVSNEIVVPKIVTQTMELSSWTLRELRTSHYLTQGDLARLFGVSISTICRVEKDSSDVGSELINKYMDAFSVNYKEIYFGNERDIARREQRNKKAVIMIMESNLLSCFEFKSRLRSADAMIPTEL